MPTPDPRTNAYRPDLADVALHGVVEAERFIEAFIRQCVRGILPLLAAPSPDARQVSQIRYGEFIDVFEVRADGFAWVQNRLDRYVGYIPFEGTLRDCIADLSYRIGALRTFVYPEPDLKSPPMDELTLGSYVQFSKRKDRFVELASGGYVFADHVVPTTEALTPDYVFTAGRLISTPFLWGGRTPKGIDSAGLVQLALDMAGIDAPRECDQQREMFGTPIQGHWRDTAWRRGDLVFFSDHVGIMTGTDHMIHATTHTMGIAVEPLIDIMARDRTLDIMAMGRF